MTEAEFQEMVSANIWHDRATLKMVIDELKLLFTPDPQNSWKSISGWVWHRNPAWRAKYVDIRIDMRDGGFVLLDRHGKRISLEQIKSQEKDPT